MKLWIARDKDNTLIIFQSKPLLDNKCNWYEILNEDFMLIPEYLFPEVTFENSPQEVELKLKNKLSFEEMD